MGIKEKLLSWGTCLCVFCVVAGWAQTSGADRSYSLEQLLSIAAQRSDQVKIIDEDYEANRQQVRFYRSEAYPQISLNAGGGIGSQGIAESSLGGFGGTPGGGSGLGKQSAAQQQVPPGTQNSDYGIDFPARITAYSFNWGLTATQPLVTFGRVRNALKLAGMQDTVLENSVRLQKDVLYLSVMQAFTTAYLADKEVGIARKSLTSAQRLLERMKIEVENGAGSQLDYLRVQAQAEGARASELTAVSNREIAYRRLSQTVGLGIDTGFTIEYDSAQSAIQVPQTDGNSTEYVLKGLESRMREVQGDYERSKLLPSIYLSAGIDNSLNISTSRDSKLNDMLVDLNQDFGDIFDYHYIGLALGLQLQWNLFDGFRTQASRSQAFAQARRARIEQQQIGEQNLIAVKENRDRLDVLAQSMEAVQSQLAAAQRAFNLVEEDYTRGFVDISDYLDTERDLREAEKRLYELRMRRLLTIGQLRINLGVPVYEGI